MRDTLRPGEAAPCGDDRNVVVDPVHPVAAIADRLLPLRAIDAGGMAVISEVRDANLLRRAAKKTILPELGRDEATIGRLIEEAQITAQLAHPNVVPVHELGVDPQGRVFFTMQLVEGRNLRAIIQAQDFARRTPADLFELLQIFLKICDAVGFAHSRGVVHRDLKPENVMVGEFGQVYVMDWGIALLRAGARPSALERGLPDPGAHRYEIETDDGMVVGTPGYLAPEQARGDIEAIDARTDVFSLGAILYQIMTQAPPYFGRSAQELVVNTLTRPIMPPQRRVTLDLPEELCRITMKALAAEPAERYQSVAELKRDVERFVLSGWQLPTRAYGPGELIVREGDAGTEAYVITAGRCQAFRRAPGGGELVLHEMRAGDVFGETAVLTGAPRSASVRAIDAVTVTVVPRAQLERETGPGTVIGQFIRTLAERFREKDGHAFDLQVELSGSEIVIAILRYMNFAGRDEGERRVAPWSTVAEVLAAYFGKPADEVAAMVARLGTFRLDPARDVIVLERAR